MQPLHNFHFLPWNLLTEAASLRALEKDQNAVESTLLSPLNSPKSRTFKAAEPQTDFPKGPRRNNNSSSASNLKNPEANTPTRRRLRLKYSKEEENTNEKEKEEKVVGDKDYFAGVINLGSRTKVDEKQQIGQCCSTVIDPIASSPKGFSLSLTTKEIEANFLLMTGKKPRQNPKKRKRSIQKRINNLCLGMNLGSVCEKAYEVKIPTKKKRFR